MGPDTYDLASLLRDSYVDLDRSAGGRADRALPGAGRGPRATPATPRGFASGSTLMALQRNLKALGTFGFQAATRGNPVYLGDVPRTLGYVRDTFERQPRFGRLRSLLAPPAGAAGSAQPALSSGPHFVRTCCESLASR